jgi:putative transposase
MVSFIDAHREVYGVERICAKLPIAPSTYYGQRQRESDSACWEIQVRWPRERVMSSQLRSVNADFGVRRTQVAI